MRFSELLTSSGLDVQNRRGDAELSRVTDDSRTCGEGDCFVAVRGTAVDGHRFIPDAVAAGASAIVLEDESLAPTGEDAPAVAVVKKTRRAAGPLAQAMFGWPARKLTCIGVTGTNGKTTVAHLIRSILTACGHDVGLLGTIQYETGGRVAPAATTTPGAIELAEMCAEMVASGRTHLVMEVSSHALHQWRTSGIDFAAGVFTNLTGDHLDYHATMKRYLAAKRRLFKHLSPNATAVINRDDPAGEEMIRATTAKTLTFGLNPLADLRARIGAIDASGMRFELVGEDGEVPVSVGLIGRHNVYNVLAAAGACQAVGLDPRQIADALGRVPPIPGRLERVPCEAGFDVFVDYAHTDDALSNVLNAVRPIVRKRLVVIFGCGGDRDRTKRPRMAGVAEQLADAIVVTSDNPRSEKPGAIIEEILAGLSDLGRSKTRVEPDRRAAIRLAIRSAEPGDVILIAGKGHETYQIIGQQRSEFDDAAVAAEEISAAT